MSQTVIFGISYDMKSLVLLRDPLKDHGEHPTGVMFSFLLIRRLSSPTLIFSCHTAYEEALWSHSAALGGGGAGG